MLARNAHVVEKVWEVIEGEYNARMEADHALPTFQQWRQEANIHKEHFTERFDLHRRMLHAATEGDMFALQACLEEGADVNYQHPESGMSALMAAAGAGKTDAVELLLWLKADVELCNNMGQTASMLAALRRCHRIIQALRRVWRERKTPLTLPTIVGYPPGLGGAPRFDFNDLHCFDDPSIHRRHDGFGEALNKLP